MNQKQQIGVALVVAAVVAAGWSYSRYSSFIGQLHSWHPPLDEFEVYTLIGAALAILCLLLGLRQFGQTQPPKAKN